MLRMSGMDRMVGMLRVLWMSELWVWRSGGRRVGGNWSGRRLYLRH